MESETKRGKFRTDNLISSVILSIFNNLKTCAQRVCRICPRFVSLSIRAFISMESNCSDLSTSTKIPGSSTAMVTTSSEYFESTLLACLWRFGTSGCHWKIKESTAVLVPLVVFDVDDIPRLRFDRRSSISACMTSILVEIALVSVELVLQVGHRPK